MMHYYTHTKIQNFKTVLKIFYKNGQSLLGIKKFRVYIFTKANDIQDTYSHRNKYCAQ